MWANSRQRHPAPQKFSANPANAPGWAVLPGNLPPASRQTPASDSTPILGWPSHRKSALVFALALALALAVAFLVVIPEGNLLLFLLLPLPLQLQLLLLFWLSFPKGICCCSCCCPCPCPCSCSSCCHSRRESAVALAVWVGLPTGNLLRHSSPLFRATPRQDRPVVSGSSRRSSTHCGRSSNRSQSTCPRPHCGSRHGIAYNPDSRYGPGCWDAFPTSPS